MTCDIVIAVWNNLDLTRSCVDSIIRNTDVINYRLIIIDNASNNETKKYLEELRDKEGARVLLVRNESNLGFIKAVNQGIRLSGAPYICLINNDTIVTKGWLSEMIGAAETSPRIGIVNPSSNTLGQNPDKGESAQAYAERLKRGNVSFTEIGSAIGFCMLIKREVIDKIGVFDEIYGMGNFEDTDYSRRAIKEGYICARAHRAYVFHDEGSSFGRDRTFDTNFERNRKIYEFRWGKRKWIAYIISSFDDNMVKALEKDIMPEARLGLWVWCFSDKRLALPEHSNIIANVFDRHFYLKTLWKVLTKKKRFSEIFVTDERFAKLLERLSFIHRAKVHYY
ncbi:MAG: glycosyltransferase family 2 protein [Candidatus Omnitrophica bacterium]|nr:glycosyltransferase family 2 protein [Candidatus Omnitrophota bacterium]